jgi:multiple sugar transport system permease protein
MNATATATPAPARPERRGRRLEQIDAVWGYLFIAAPIIGFLVFAAGPLLASIVLTFMRWDLFSAPRWIGLDNWQKAFFSDPLVWTAMYNTAYLLLAVPISMAVAFFLATLMNQRVLGRNIFRVIYYLPNILPIAAVALIWLWIFNPDYGLLNYTLRSLGVPADWTRINWLQNRATVKPALIIMGVWGGLGFQALIYLAGLQGVPRQLYEAAEIDGAGAWAKFWNVTWPALTPTTFFLLVTSLAGGFQTFVQPYIMTNGGPYNASLTIVMLVWRNAFRDLNMGYASAQAWLVGSVIIVITTINFVLARRWVFYEE